MSVKPITQTLALLQGGTFLDQCSELFAGIVKGVDDTGKAGRVIVGGESGHGARPIRAEWVEGLRSQCEAAGVAFFFKQWGGQTATAGGCELGGVEVKQWPQTA